MLWVALMMIGETSSAALKAYLLRIESLVNLWPGAWHLICTADDKCRCEHMQYLHDELTFASSPPSGYDPAKPWDYIFFKAAKDTDFWEEHVRHPATA